MGVGFSVPRAPNTRTPPSVGSTAAQINASFISSWPTMAENGNTGRTSALILDPFSHGIPAHWHKPAGDAKGGGPPSKPHSSSPLQCAGPENQMQHREHPNGRMSGIAFMMAAVFVFSIMDALMKRLSAHYGPLEIACLRSLASLGCITLAIAWRGAWASLRAQGPFLHLLRAVLGIAMLTSFVFAVHRLTLAQTYSLFLAAPLLMTALSVPIFADRVAPRRWFAIICGMSGVLWVLQPWSKGAFSLVAAAAAAI